MYLSYMNTSARVRFLVADDVSHGTPMELWPRRAVCTAFTAFNHSVALNVLV